jgi:hypothetical protein
MTLEGMMNSTFDTEEMPLDQAELLLESLWEAAQAGDNEAAIFLRMFAPWLAVTSSSSSLPTCLH